MPEVAMPMYTTHGPMLDPPLTRVSFQSRQPTAQPAPLGQHQPKHVCGNLVEPLHGRCTAPVAHPHGPLKQIHQILGPPAFWLKCDKVHTTDHRSVGLKFANNIYRPPHAMSGPHGRPTAKLTAPSINQHQTGWSASLPTQSRQTSARAASPS